mmetsp:Transcript_30140/g.76164  ORF Transcript_30140/g.76164 Transcript_30140/m.76164 type:complete len:595 (-) Transcript_30140:283-2067(-)
MAGKMQGPGNGKREKKAAQPTAAEDAQTILAEYGRAWCVQQFLPFLDKTIGVAGAMDFRMIQNPADWHFRLPILVLAFLMPKPGVLMAAHVINIAALWYWMPAVWDHLVWAMLTECVFVMCCVFSNLDVTKLVGYFYPAVTDMLVMLYTSAAFWKLTTSFLNPVTSCAPVLTSELAAALFPPSVMPAGGTFAWAILMSSPVLIVVLEYVVPAVLWYFPPLGVLVGLKFHQMINLMPMTYAGGFSIAMCSRYVLFLPGAVTRALGSGGNWLLASAIWAGILALMHKVHHGQLDASGVAFIILGFLYTRSIFSFPSAEITWPGGHAKSVSAATKGGLLRFQRVAATSLGFLYGYMFPILGLMNMASSNMYGNVKMYGGSNHYLVPTGLITDYFAVNDGPDWAVDAFGGGLVRVEATNSSVLRWLNPADSSANLPVHAREMLHALGAPGKYFDLYSTRNYFDREDELNACALRAIDEADEATKAALEDPDMKYVMPAYELRRSINLQRKRAGEVFSVKYTHVPSKGSPREWQHFKGPLVEHLEDTSTGAKKCSVDGKPCAQTETVLLGAPPRWLTLLLHPYPVPLLPDMKDDVYCST